MENMSFRLFAIAVYVLLGLSMGSGEGTNSTCKLSYEQCRSSNVTNPTDLLHQIEEAREEGRDLPIIEWEELHLKPAINHPGQLCPQDQVDMQRLPYMGRALCPL